MLSMTSMRRNTWTWVGLAVTAGVLSAGANGQGLQSARNRGSGSTTQLGSLPGSGGPASSANNVLGPGGECDVYDDGVTENSLGFNAASGTDVLWMHKEGTAAGTTTVVSISTAWGTPLFGGTSAPPAGTPVRVGIWDDPNDDGNPNDLVLLQEISTTSTNPNTDIFQVVPIAPQVTNGIYFIGASSAGRFPAPMDENSTSSGRAWVTGDNAGTIDYANLNGEPLPPGEMDAIGFPAVFLLRADCTGAPMTGFCYPNAGGTRSCPCGNQPVPNDGTRGCNNFGPTPAGGTGGAIMTASGTPTASVASTLVFHVTDMQTPATIVVLFCGTTTLSPGVISGAGVRCVSNLQVPRPYKSVSGFNASAIDFPSANSNPNVDAWTRSNTPGAGTTKHYYAAYRNPQAGSNPPCTPAAAFNLTNAGSVTWQP